MVHLKATAVSLDDVAPYIRESSAHPLKDNLENFACN